MIFNNILSFTGLHLSDGSTASPPRLLLSIKDVFGWWVNEKRAALFLFLECLVN
jgi:hypothetical protein